MAFMYNLIIGIISTVASVVMMVGMAVLAVVAVDSGTTMVVGSLLLFLLTMVLIIGGLIFLGSPLSVGYYRMNLDIADGKDAKLETLFTSFKKGYWNTVKLFLLYFLVMLACVIPVVILEFLFLVIAAALDSIVLFVVLFLGGYIGSIVGIMVITYRYAMVFFILAEYPEMRAIDVMRSSATMMKGRKWKLFCLQFSFVGWVLLLFLIGTCTCGIALTIGIYPLMTYMNVSMAMFYDDAANREAAREAVFPSLNPDDYDPDANAEEQV